MANITADEVRYAGNFDSTVITDAMLASKAYIPNGDAWLTKILSKNGTDLATLAANDTNKQALALAAEIYYVASLVAAIPPKDDFSFGPAKSSRVKAAEKKVTSDDFYAKAKEALDQAGFIVEEWEVSCMGGNEYHPNNDEDTQIDLALARDDSDETFNPMGAEIL